MEDLSNAAPEAPANTESQPEAPASSPFKADSEAIVSERAKEASEKQEIRAELGKIFDKHKAQRQAAEKDREPDGKFAKPAADKASEAESTKDTAQKEPVKKDQQPKAEKAPAVQETKTPEKPAIEAPKRWSADKKAVWDSLPHEAREYVAKMESETEKDLGRLGQFAKSMEPVARLLGEAKDSFERRGMSYEKGLSELLKAQQALDRNPQAAIEHLAKVYGVKLGQSEDAESVFGPDPEVETLKSEVATLKGYLEKLGGTVQQREAAEREARLAETQKLIDDFAADKPDWAELEAETVHNFKLIRQSEPNLSQKETLEKAFERAQWANPNSRQRLLEKRAKEADAKKLEEAKKAASTANRAAALNIEGSPTPTDQVDLRSQLGAIWDKRNAA